MPKIKLKVASSENEDKIFKAFSDKMDKYEMQGVSREVNEEVEKHLEMGEMYQDQRKVNDAIAESNKLLFVDNQSEFAKLKTLNEYEKQEYFAEDGHCNAEGYQVIAKNVYRVLRFEAEELLK